MNTTSTGKQAENVAAKYLKSQGYEIIERNWRTRWCEIDIIAQKDGVIYFVEVKFRKHAYQGGGLDYITTKKLKQMQFAAEFWVQANNWQNNYELSALELETKNLVIKRFVPTLT